MKTVLGFWIIVLLVFVLMMLPVSVQAHCDTMDGPVVKAAKLALEKGDVGLALRWVKKGYEDDVKQAYWKTVAVRSLNKEVQGLADTYFFETLVRLHRQGEGVPYTGIKPASTPVKPSIEMAEATLESGNVDDMIKKVTEHAAIGLREKYGRAVKARRDADRTVEAGREYVEAYVTYIHYVEGIHNAIESQSPHHEVSEIKGKVH